VRYNCFCRKTTFICYQSFCTCRGPQGSPKFFFRHSQMQNLMLIPNITLKFENNEVLTEKSLLLLNHTNKGSFLIFVITWPSNVIDRSKIYRMSVKLHFQSESCNKAFESRALNSFKVKYSNNQRKTGFWDLLT